MGADKELTLEEKLRQGVLMPGEAFPLRQSVELQFKENALTDLKEKNEQLKLRLTESKGSSTKRKLVVTVEGIHTGMTKNRTFYPGNTLEESIPTWITPHNKPVIKNHNLYAEPLGRIIHSEYVESTLTDKYTVRLKLEITDEDAIDKIVDGRYLTLSVGGSANRVTCSVCSKDLVKEGYCGHRRGQTYDGKEAYWIISNYTGDEISFVNQPADVFSQVIAAELVTAEGGKQMKQGQEKEGVDQEGAENKKNIIESESQKTDPTNLIDNLLNEDQDDDKDPQQKVVEDDNSDTGNPDLNDPKNPNESEDDADDDLEKVKEKLQKANEKISELEALVEARETENTSLAVQVSNLTENADTLQKNLDSAEEEKQTLVETNITLARFARKTMAERVADLRIIQGKDAEEKRESLIAEWSQSSTKVLETQIQDLLKGRRQIEKVDNPGQVIAQKGAPIVNEDDEVIDDGVTKKKVAEASKPKTLKDFESGMKRSIFRMN